MDLKLVWSNKYGKDDDYDSIWHNGDKFPYNITKIGDYTGTSIKQTEKFSRPLNINNLGKLPLHPCNNLHPIINLWQIFQPDLYIDKLSKDKIKKKDPLSSLSPHDSRQHEGQRPVLVSIPKYWDDESNPINPIVELERDEGINNTDFSSKLDGMYEKYRGSVCNLPYNNQIGMLQNCNSQQNDICNEFKELKNEINNIKKLLIQLSVNIFKPLCWKEVESWWINEQHIGNYYGYVLYNYINDFNLFKNLLEMNEIDLTKLYIELFQSSPLSPYFWRYTGNKLLPNELLFQYADILKLVDETFNYSDCWFDENNGINLSIIQDSVRKKLYKYEEVWNKNTNMMEAFTKPKEHTCNKLYFLIKNTFLLPEDKNYKRYYKVLYDNNIILTPDYAFDFTKAYLILDGQDKPIQISHSYELNDIGILDKLSESGKIDIELSEVLNGVNDKENKISLVKIFELVKNDNIVLDNLSKLEIIGILRNLFINNKKLPDKYRLSLPKINSLCEHILLNINSRKQKEIEFLTVFRERWSKLGLFSAINNYIFTNEDQLTLQKFNDNMNDFIRLMNFKLETFNELFDLLCPYKIGEEKQNAWKSEFYSAGYWNIRDLLEVNIQDMNKLLLHLIGPDSTLPNIYIATKTEIIKMIEIYEDDLRGEKRIPKLAMKTLSFCGIDKEPTLDVFGENFSQKFTIYDKSFYENYDDFKDAKGPIIIGKFEKKGTDIEKYLDNIFDLKYYPNKGLSLDYNSSLYLAKSVWSSKNGGYNNYILFGNPGTGKTTLAKRMAKLFCLLGSVKRPILNSIMPDDLLSNYIGQSLKNTQAYLLKHQGEIIYIDEAHQLAGGSDEFNFGKEVISGLMNFITGIKEGNFEKTVIILSGYEEPMKELLDMDEGLSRRFPIEKRIKLESMGRLEASVTLLSKVTELTLDNCKKIINKIYSGPYNIDSETQDGEDGPIGEYIKENLNYGLIDQIHAIINEDKQDVTDINNVDNVDNIINKYINNWTRVNMEKIRPKINENIYYKCGDNNIRNLGKTTNLENWEDLKKYTPNIYKITKAQNVEDNNENLPEEYKDSITEWVPKNNDEIYQIILIKKEGNWQQYLSEQLGSETILVKNLEPNPKYYIINGVKTNVITDNCVQEGGDISHIIGNRKFYRYTGKSFLYNNMMIPHQFGGYIVKNRKGDKFIKNSLFYIPLRKISHYNIEKIQSGGTDIAWLSPKLIFDSKNKYDNLYLILNIILPEYKKKYVLEYTNQCYRAKIEPLDFLTLNDSDIKLLLENILGNNSTIVKSRQITKNDIFSIISMRDTNEKENYEKITKLYKTECLQIDKSNISDLIDKEFIHFVGKSIIPLKTTIITFCNQIVNQVPENKIPGTFQNYILYGPPGTGKTVIGNLLKKVFCKFGILMRNKSITIQPNEFLGNSGNTSEKTKEILDRNQGGIIFIDEAHQLIPEGNTNKMDVITTLMNFITLVDKGKRLPTIIILAGYEIPIHKFLEQDDGMSRRFPEYLRFKLQPYNPIELSQMFFLDSPINIATLKYSTKIFCNGCGCGDYSNDDIKEKYKSAVTTKLKEAFNLEKQTDISTFPCFWWSIPRQNMIEPGMFIIAKTHNGEWKRTTVVGIDPNTKNVICKKLGQVKIKNTKIPPFPQNKIIGDADNEWKIVETIKCGINQLPDKTGTGDTVPQKLILPIQTVPETNNEDKIYSDKVNVSTFKGINYVRILFEFIKKYYPDTWLYINEELNGGLVENIKSSSSITDNTITKDDVCKYIIDLIWETEGKLASDKKLELALSNFVTFFDETLPQSKILYKRKYSHILMNLNFRNPVDFITYEKNQLERILKITIGESSELKKNYQLSNAEIESIYNKRSGKADRLIQIFSQSALKECALDNISINPTSVDIWNIIKKEIGINDDFTIKFINESSNDCDTNQLISIVLYKFAIQRIWSIQNSPNKPSFMNFLMTGCPGTGKTYIGKKIGNILCKLGITNRPNFVTKTKADFIKGYVGQSSVATKKILYENQGGTIFIDEAHQLKDGLYGRECLLTIMNFMTQVEKGQAQPTIIILAGYPHQINEMLKIDPGFDRRFPEPYRIRLKSLNLIDMDPSTQNIINTIWKRLTKNENGDLKIYGDITVEPTKDNICEYLQTELSGHQKLYIQDKLNLGFLDNFFDSCSINSLNDLSQANIETNSEGVMEIIQKQAFLKSAVDNFFVNFKKNSENFMKTYIVGNNIKSGKEDMICNPDYFKKKLKVVNTTDEKPVEMSVQPS